MCVECMRDERKVTVFIMGIDASQCNFFCSTDGESTHSGRERVQMERAHVVEERERAMSWKF